MNTTAAWRLSAIASLAAAAALWAAPAYATPDTDCADYPTRAAAQAAFDAHGGSPTNNWHGLDNDHDGHACEHHRFPGQPTPPPNPGPSGCAVCPTPSAPASPSPQPSPSNPGPGESAEPPEPPMTELPITGNTTQTVLTLLGTGLIIIGSIGIAVSRRRA